MERDTFLLARASLCKKTISTILSHATIPRADRQLLSDRSFLVGGVLAGYGPAADPDPDDPDPAKPPPTKKERSDNNWRSARVIVVQDKKVEIIFLQRDALAKSNVSLSKTASQQKAKVKKLEHKNYVDTKSSRTASLEKEEQHKLAIALLCENHACDIEAAFAVADEETNKKLEGEKFRLIAKK